MAELADISVDLLLENFEFLGDWEERYAYIIDLGRKLPPMPPEDQVEEHRVHGCQATVWIKETLEATEPPTISISASSDALIVKGLIAILSIIFSGRTPEEALAVDARGILGRLALAEHLSPTRQNGLWAMVERIRELAARHASTRGTANGESRG